MMKKSDTTIYIIRHGELNNPKNVLYDRELNFSLSKIGRKHIKKLAEKLKKFGADPFCIYSSPLLRTKQTSLIIKKIFNLREIILDIRLLEVDSRGVAGNPLAMHKYFTYQNSGKGYWMEAPKKQAKRIRDCIRDIRKKYSGKTVFVVSHGDPLAFGIYTLVNPKKKFPTIDFLEKHFYFKKAQAFKLVFDSKGRMIEDRFL